jgi:hypothetical protein
MQRASAPGIPASALKLAYLIAFKYMNRDTRSTFVGQDTLAADLDTTDRSVRNLLAILRPLGLAIEPGNGRGKASVYRIEAIGEGEKRKRDAAKGGNSATEKVETSFRPTKERTKEAERECLRTPLSAGKETAPSAQDESPSIGGSAGAAPDLFGQHAERPQTKTETEPVAPKGTPEGECADGVEINPPAVVVGREEQDWRNLRALWERGWASDDTPKAQAIARQAFAKACREGADPGEIIDGARVWIAAFEAGDGVRYLPPLPQWLAIRGWEKAPAAKPKRGRNPSGRPRDHLPRSNGNKVDGTRLAFQMAGYVEDENGWHHPDGDEGSSFDWRASL